MLRNQELDEARRDLMNCDAANQDLVALTNLVATLRTSTLLLLRAVDHLSATFTNYVADTRLDLTEVKANLQTIARHLHR